MKNKKGWSSEPNSWEWIDIITRIGCSLVCGQNESHSVVSDSLWPHGLNPAKLLCPWTSPGQNTPVGSCFLLQGSSQPSNWTRSLTLQVDSSQTEPPGMPMVCAQKAAVNRSEWVKSLSRVRLCDSMDCSLTRFLHPWDFPGKKTGVSCHFLLQEIFPTQGLNPGLLHCRQTLYRLSHQGRSEPAY